MGILRNGIRYGWGEERSLICNFFVNVWGFIFLFLKMIRIFVDDF